jgi:hypothetical protein
MAPWTFYNSSGEAMIEDGAAIAATQAEMETATATGDAAFVTPGRTQYHPGVAKAWLFYNGATPAVIASYGISGVVENSTGNYTISFSTDFSTVNYCAVVYHKQNGITNAAHLSDMPTLAVGTYAQAFTIDGTNYRDQNPLCIAFYGDI